MALTGKPCSGLGLACMLHMSTRPLAVDDLTLGDHTFFHTDLQLTISGSELWRLTSAPVQKPFNITKVPYRAF
jgi:hypothetical protein